MTGSLLMFRFEPSNFAKPVCDGHLVEKILTRDNDIATSPSGPWRTPDGQ